MMNVHQRFPGVHWIWGGGISFVYEVHPQIVVKVPKSGESETAQFRKEIEIYKKFARYPPCPSVVQCFFYSDHGLFLEYLRDASLSSRIQHNHIRDPQTMIVTKVKRLEPLSTRKQWMNDLALAVAFLESLNLAHGDLRPENILLDGDQLKLADFDCTAEIGTYFEACTPPYGRILNDSELEHGKCGTAGFLGPRTEQFALGSLFYLINYGFEVYGDQCLTRDPREHGPKVVDLLQNMDFPKLSSNPLVDGIINKCWHNEYVTIKELAADTSMLLDRGNYEEDNGTAMTNQYGTNVDGFIKNWLKAAHHIISRILGGVGNLWGLLVRIANRPAIKPVQSGRGGDVGEVQHAGRYNIKDQEEGNEFFSKKKLCQDLEESGLLRLLCSDEPHRLGFTLEGYRHSSHGH